MLSVNSVNLVRQQPAFRSGSVAAPFEAQEYYTKDAYESDKSKLEQQLDDMNELIENVSVPKPVRTFGKIVSIGIAVALGLVSMKYGAQGMVKLFHKGVNAVKNFASKPACQEIINGTKKLFSDAKNKIAEKGGELFAKFKQSTAGKKVAGYAEKFSKSDFANKVKEVSNKIKDSKAMAKVKEVSNKVKDSKAMAKAKEYTKQATTKIKGITSEKVEKGIVNLFAVSGGVTGGITALQETAGDNE